MSHDSLEHTPLGQDVNYQSPYNPKLLCPIPRQNNRATIGIKADSLPFHGVDIWNAYEISWLDPKGKPHVATMVFSLDCSTPCLVESKSIKLYLNSLNQTVFEDMAAVQACIAKDMSAYAEGTVTVSLHEVTQQATGTIDALPGECIDGLDIDCDSYNVSPTFLATDAQTLTSETLVSHLLKSNCPVTGQPDWGSVQIRYTGPQINHEGLLKYIVSFRLHDEFHEQCIERMFMDILQRCQPSELSIYGRYTRRGGLDINPWRVLKLAKEDEHPQIAGLPANLRLVRQ